MLYLGHGMGTLGPVRYWHLIVEASSCPPCTGLVVVLYCTVVLCCSTLALCTVAEYTIVVCILHVADCLLYDHLVVCVLYVSCMSCMYLACILYVIVWTNCCREHVWYMFGTCLVFCLSGTFYLSTFRLSLCDDSPKPPPCPNGPNLVSVTTNCPISLRRLLPATHSHPLPPRPGNLAEGGGS